MSDDVDGGNGADGGQVAERDSRGRKGGAAVDRTRMATDVTWKATRAAWLAGSGLSKSVIQYGTRHNRPEDSAAEDDFASDWCLITAVKGGSGRQKASWEAEDAADDAVDVVVTKSPGGNLSLYDMSRILAQAGRERSNTAAKSRDSAFAITLVTSVEELGVAFEDERHLSVRSKEERLEIKSNSLTSPPKKSRNDDSSQESPSTVPRRGSVGNNRGGPSRARGGGAVRARGAAHGGGAGRS